MRMDVVEFSVAVVVAPIVACVVQASGYGLGLSFGNLTLLIGVGLWLVMRKRLVGQRPSGGGRSQGLLIEFIARAAWLGVVAWCFAPHQPVWEYAAFGAGAAGVYVWAKAVAG